MQYLGMETPNTHIYICMPKFEIVYRYICSIKAQSQGSRTKLKLTTKAQIQGSSYWLKLWVQVKGAAALSWSL